jgi:hypothetical protein
VPEKICVPLPRLYLIFSTAALSSPCFIRPRRRKARQPQTPPPPELSGHSISRQSNRRAVACTRRFPCRLLAVSRDSLTTSEDAGGETPPLRRTASDPIVHGVDVRLIHRNPRTPTAHRFAAGNPGAVPLPQSGKVEKTRFLSNIKFLF